MNELTTVANEDLTQIEGGCCQCCHSQFPRFPRGGFPGGYYPRMPYFPRRWWNFGGFGRM